MKTGAWLVAAAALGASVSSARAGTTAADFLTLGVGAPNHEAGASGPTARGASSIDWNPAGAADQYDAYVSHEMLPMGVSFDYLSADLPIESMEGTLGLSVRSLIQGGIPELDNQGNAEGSFSARDLAAAATWAQTWGESRFGVTARVIDQSIAQTSGKGFSGDVGWQTPLGRGTAGIAVTNLGPSLALASESFPLPTTVRAGLSWPLLRGLDGSLSLSQVEAVGTTGSVGLSYTVARLVSFDVGYQAGGTNSAGYNGFCAGASITVGPARADVGYQAYGLLGSVIQLGLGYRFGSGTAAKPEASAAPMEPQSSWPPAPAAAPASAPAIPAGAPAVIPASAPAAVPAAAPAVIPASAPAPAAVPTAPADATPAPAQTTPAPTEEPDIDRFSHDW